MIETTIEGLYILELTTFNDDRGFFREVYRKEDLGIDFTPVQLNHSYSLPHVIRGLHAENWNKLIYPLAGNVFIAIADIRLNSNTFGKVETFTIDHYSRVALFISNGLANSICVMGNEPIHYLYLVDNMYNGDKTAVTWNDPDLDIKWPIENPILSERDKNNPTLRELFPAKFKEYV